MQVKGAAKIMVTVVATQELKPGDVLRRFKADAFRDDIHGSIRSLASGWCLEIVTTLGRFF